MAYWNRDRVGTAAARLEGQMKFCRHCNRPLSDLPCTCSGAETESMLIGIGALAVAVAVLLMVAGLL